MQKLKYAAGAIFAAIICGAVYFYFYQFSSEATGKNCLAIYLDIIPKGAEFERAEIEGRELKAIYRSSEGEGSVTCYLQGREIDPVDTINRKIEIMWADPTLVPRVEDLD